VDQQWKLLLQNELPDNQYPLHPLNHPQLVQEQQEEPSIIHQVAWWYGQSDVGGFVVEVIKIKEQEVVVVQGDQWVALEVHDVQEAVE